MKNRLFTLIPTLFLLFSFNAYANLALTCAVVLESGNEQYAGTTITVCPGDLVEIQWVEDYYPAASIGDIKLSYGPSATSVHHTIGTQNHTGIINLDKMNWTVPMSVAGQWLYIKIVDLDNTPNSFVVACDVQPSPRGKTGSAIPSPIALNCAPNPVVNSLKINGNIDNPINSVRLYDIAGNNVAYYAFRESYNETIDVSALPSGTYVAIINEEKQFKIVKR